MIRHSIEEVTPAMQQYLLIKQKYEDAILLYRMGDFYEMFYDDAITASKDLDLILTSKACGNEKKAPMCGVPFHAVQTYIAKLIDCGHKVAICEQLTKPQKGVKTLERDVVRVITPGTLIDDEMLEGQKNNYLLCIYKNEDVFGISYVDISTGIFEVMNVENNAEQEISDLVSRINPAEIIGNEQAKIFFNSLPILNLGTVRKMNNYYDWAFSKSRADDNLKKQFGVNYEEVYDLKGKDGVYKKITLLGQNVNSYGNDNNEGVTFAKLLHDICALEGDFTLSFMTSHPKDLTDDVIDAIANEDKIEKYIHLPAQSGNNRILKIMNRKYTREKYLGIIKKIREKIPNCRITSDFIVGFPTETEEEFNDTYSLVKEVRYDSIFAFMYSPRDRKSVV